MQRKARGRHSLLTYALYARAMVREFRWTLVNLVVVMTIGTAVLYAATPGGAATIGSAVFGAWMALLGQPQVPATSWMIGLLEAVFPVFGFVLVGEGVVRLALLMLSRERGEKEWMKVMASTYRDHVVLCGLGHLGCRVLEQLVSARVPVVALEKDESSRFLPQARATGAPILIRDMTDDNALIEAGIPHARVVIIATNNDMANLEVALDSRRMNPHIRIVMRLFDQQIASKIAKGIDVDAAFSSSALAAPIVAALSLECRVLASYPVAGVLHVLAELRVDEAGLADLTFGEIEAKISGRIVARTSGGANALTPADGKPKQGDVLLVHAPAEKVVALAGGRDACPVKALVE